MEVQNFFVNQEKKYEEIAEKEIETDRFLTELLGVETLLGIGIVLAIVELQHFLKIPENLIIYLIITLIAFFTLEMFRLEETQKELKEKLEKEKQGKNPQDDG